MSLLDVPDPQYTPNIKHFNIICRICLRKNSDKVKMQPLRSFRDKYNQNKQINLIAKIEMCSEIKIDNENVDKLPKNICNKCYNLLLIAHYFKILANNSDKILRNVINTNPNKQEIINEMHSIKIENDNEPDWLDDDCSVNEEGTSLIYNADMSVMNEICIDSKNLVFSCDICHLDFSDKSSLSDHINSHAISKNIKNKSSNVKSKKIQKENKIRKVKKRNKLSKEVKTRKSVSIVNNINEEIKQEMDETKHELEENKVIDDEMLGYFECLICNKSFNYKEDLSKHMFSHDNNLSKYKCYGCDALFDKYSQRTQHEKYYCPKMPPGTKYECSKCKAKCDNRFRFDTHVKFGCSYKPVRPEMKTIELEPLLKCQHCELTTMNKSTLRNHILNCHTEEKPYICEICGKGYAMVSSLNSHRKQSHTTEKKYKCSYCPYAARQQSSLNVHTRRHTLEYRYSCEICGASFKQNTGYHIHMRRYHKEKEHQCEICKKMFSEKAAMKQHVSSVHLGLKPHECKVCGAAFSRKRSLKAHLLRAHNIVMANNSLYDKVVQVTTLTNDEVASPS